ncbi:hypothetical protein AVEN_113665-1 [Araneus ventricosus]|uniref:Uncharacterized protein n=1 Tax=Araneus ventricosus TaxID=182803 RepID=A0A4Y2NUH0_ARAVE|nr:hypothetical protein AVEN_113665-1 [Araneus ventricosus]
MVYGSARPTVLRRLDTIHHSALRICSGAFRTSPVESLLQDLSKLFISKLRDIRAAVRDGIIENSLLPIIDKFAARETSLMATIFDLKAKHVDTDLVFYQAKVRDCENTIEGLRAKLQLVNTDLTDAKDELKKTSSALVETAKEICILLDQPRPSYTEVLKSSPLHCPTHQ